MTVRFPFSDPHAIEIENADSCSGSLSRTSYVRSGKIFTANESLMASEVGKLNDDSFRNVASVVVRLLQSNIPA